MSTQPNNATVVHKPKSKSNPKRRSRIKLIMGGLAALFLGLVAVIAAVVGYALWGNPEMTDRPLVLIHSPLNKEQVSEGDGVLVHATARSKAGIRRVELWADDLLIAQRDADKDASPTSMVLSADWVPTIAGDHRLVVRAISASDVDGQASILVESFENDEPEPTGAHTVQEGETLDAIAQGYGTTAEDLTILNPGLDPAAPPTAGTEIIVPDSEPPSEGSQPIPTDSEPPPAEGEAPALFDFLFFGELVSVPRPPAEPTQLRLELLSLRTPQDYEGLTCYIGMAGREPRRYPDADWDPSTDESFARVKNKNGTGWNVADYLSGKRVPAFSWPEDRPLLFDIACVGIGGGGTQALRLGRVEMAIPPNDWDGTVKQTEVIGSEGSFTIGYRIGRTQPKPPIIRPDPVTDPNMPAPTNLFMRYRRLTSLIFEPLLTWDYPDEEPIDGFRVYLNGTLQWIVPADQINSMGHYTLFPSQWQHPPCGDEYTVAVTAWRSGEGDGYESNPGQSSITFETPADDCLMRGRITFETLETFELDGDGKHEHRDGKIGPPHGYFYAGDERINFDADDLGGDGIRGLNDNSLYQLSDNGFWRFDRPPSFVIETEDDWEWLWFGFHIMDEDSGSCDEDGDDPGCDDLICEGSAMVSFEYWPYYREDAFYSSDGQRDPRCKVTYRWEALRDNPLGASAGWPLPMPSLSISNIFTDHNAQTTHFTVTNDGLATWVSHPLEIKTRSGVSWGIITFEDFYLEPGRSIELETSENFSYSHCLTPDPDNKVQEIADSWGDREVCRKSADLDITKVSFEGEAGGTIHVTVKNTGDGPL